MVTIIDVAKRANVSITTVSRVLNNSDHKVSPTARKRVLAAVDELDYHPNALAKGLLQKKTMTIGVIVPDISNAYYAEIVRGIQDTAARYGYCVILLNNDRRADRLAEHIRLLREKNADGLIVAGGSFLIRDTPILQKPLANRTVAIGRAECAVPSIRIDNMGAVTDAVRLLVRYGHRRIGLISGQIESSATMSERLAGYWAGLGEHCIRYESRLVVFDDLTLSGGYSAGRILLGLRERPTAVIAANDQMAFGAAKAARDFGMRIPEDLALVGFDNLPLCEYFNPSITSIEIPRYDIGAASMKLLFRILRGEAESAAYTESPCLYRLRLIERESTCGRR